MNLDKILSCFVLVFGKWKIYKPRVNVDVPEFWIAEILPGFLAVMFDEETS